MRCEVCGNDYDKPLIIEYLDEEYVFDCFECAIEELAPRCANCGIRIIGHGMEVGDHMVCSKHCASEIGYTGMRDRA